jgi:myosin protein heavy chain
MFTVCQSNLQACLFHCSFTSLLLPKSLLQALLEEETKQKMALKGELRQAEASKEQLREQLEEEEEGRRGLDKQIAALTIQLAEAKKRADEEAANSAALEEIRKKLAKVSHLDCLECLSPF